AGVDLLGIAAQREIQRNDVPMKGRLAHREEQLLRVRHGSGRFLAGEREARDLVGDPDEPAEQRGALDDRGVARRVRDGGYVLHEADEELRASDRVELLVRGEL